MAKTVKLTAEFTYRMDKSRSRTLPKGWRGEVPEDLAAAIEAEGKGEVVSSIAPGDTAAEKAKPARKPRAKKAPAAPTQGTDSSDLDQEEDQNEDGQSQADGEAAGE